MSSTDGLAAGRSNSGASAPSNEEQSFLRAKGCGRRIEVSFQDGEILVGFTLGYSSSAPGFFIFPVDPKSNNSRIFVVNSAVEKINWL